MTTPNGTLAVIDGGGQDRILSTGNGMTATTVTLYNLTFRNGNAGSGNGGRSSAAI